MLKVQQASDISKFHNFKCGDIYCLTPFTYNVSCCLCGAKVSFEQFPQHFQQQHLSDEDSEAINITAEAVEDPIKNEDEFKYDTEFEIKPQVCLGEDETEDIVDEKPIDISKIKIDDAETKDSLDDNAGKVKKKTEEILQSIRIEDDAAATITAAAEVVKKAEEEEEKSTHSDEDPSWANDDDTSDKSGSDGDADFDNDDDNDLDWGDTTATTNKEAVTYDCPICQRKYKSKKSLSHHKVVAHNPLYKHRKKSILEHKCEECGEIFRSERNLRGHMWKHTGIVCDVCGKTFTQTGNMMRHKIRHTGIKSHQCKECDNSFYTAKELKAHMMRHTGIMPIICEICGRRCMYPPQKL